MRIIILILLALNLSSCHRLVLTMNHVRKAKIESNASLQKFVTNAGLPDTNLLHVDSSSSWKMAEKFLFETVLPRIELYNSKGQLVRGYNLNECSATIVNEFPEMKFDAMAPIGKGMPLQEILACFETKSGTKLSLSDLQPCKGAACIYWTKSLGKVTENVLTEWTNELRKNPDNGIKIIYLNLDMHESWGIKSKDDDRYLIFEY